MKITELISELEKLKEKHGNMPIIAWKDCEYFKIDFVAPELDKKDGKEVIFVMDINSNPVNPKTYIKQLTGKTGQFKRA